MFKLSSSALLVLLLHSMTACQEPNNSQDQSHSIQSNEDLASTQNTYLETIEDLNKNFFKNYGEMEKIILQQLKKEGPDYFMKGDRYELLGKFESTLAIYCQICERLKASDPSTLLTSYLHLNDLENVKKQYNAMQDGPNAFIYKEFSQYKDSGKLLEAKYVSIRYDERVEEFAKAVFEHVSTIEEYITQEWPGQLPPKIRVMLLYSDGPGPYNVNLNETYLPVKSRPLNSSFQVAGHIVHETFHLVNTHVLQQKCDFEIGMQTNSFKFLDEGYAQLIESKFMGRYEQNRTIMDDYSRELLLSKSFDFKELKSRWSELFSRQDLLIYHLAYSFSYFLEEKYGAEKLNELFLPANDVLKSSWVEHVESSLESPIDDLLEEWKQKLVQ